MAHWMVRQLLGHYPSVAEAAKTMQSRIFRVQRSLSFSIDNDRQRAVDVYQRFMALPLALVAGWSGFATTDEFLVCVSDLHRFLRTMTLQIQLFSKNNTVCGARVFIGDELLNDVHDDTSYAHKSVLG